MRIFLLVPLLFLISCTNATPDIGKVFEVTGPVPEQSSYEVSDLSSSIHLKGSCASQYNNFLVSVNDSSWIAISSVIDTAFPSDIDCSNSNFNFYLSPSLLNLSDSSNVSKILLKQESNGETTKVYELNVSYLNTLRATILNSPLSKTSSTAFFQIGGTDIDSFKYKFGKYVNCYDPQGYSSSQPIGDLSLSLTSFTDGTVYLCILGGNATAYQPISKATVFSWELDLTPPDEPIFNSLPNIFDNKSSYSIRVSSETAVKYKVKLSMNNDCEVDSGYTTKMMTESFSFLIDSSKENTNLYLCAYSYDDVGNVSIIKSYSWLQDMIIPNPPVAVLSSNLVSYNTYSPVISLASPSDSGSPFENYLIQIIKTSDMSIIKDWTPYPIGGASIKIVGLSLLDGEYKLYIKLNDKAGNQSSVSYGGAWTVDTMAPTVSPQVLTTPYQLNFSAQFKVAFSDSSGISFARATLFDGQNNLVSGPMNISNNTSFYFSSLSLTKNSLYYIKVEVADTVGNLTEIGDISYTSANCVTTNPNDITVIAGICNTVTTSSVIGWKMQGGILLGSDPSGAGKILVVPEDPQDDDFSFSYEWGIQTTNNFIGTPAQTDPADPMVRSGLTLGAFAACASQNINGINGWFLPTINQMTKIVCHSNFNTLTYSQALPQRDPGCVSSGRSNLVNLNPSSTYWTVTEYSASEAYAVDYSASFFQLPKSDVETALCIRRFSKNY